MAEECFARPAGAALTPGHLALTEATHGAAGILATINRSETPDAVRGKEIDGIGAAARRTMETMDGSPARRDDGELSP